MIPDELARLTNRRGGVEALAVKIGVSRMWVYRRLTGEVAIRKPDETLIRAAVE